MILLDLYIFIIIDLYNYFIYKSCFLYIIHVIQSSDCEVFSFINDLSIFIYLALDSVLIWGFGHFCNCFDHGGWWANSVWVELEPYEHHLLCFKNIFGSIQFELYFAHTYQEMIQIFITIFLMNEDIICNVADPFQSCNRLLVVLFDTPQGHLRHHTEDTATDRDQMGLRKVVGKLDS